jgi:glucokinase
VGGTKVALAVGDEAGRVRERLRRPTEPTGCAERDLERIAEEARSLLARAGVPPGELARAGVSLPGPLDPEAGVLHHPPNLPGWGVVPVKALLEAPLGCPVRVDNDANASAIAEWRFGAARGASHAVFLTMSTGVGCGLVLGGRPYRGARGGAGEVGHAPVEWDGEPCACGQRGCLEAYVGGAAWTRRLNAVAPPGGLVRRLAGGGEVRPEHAVEAARSGDAFARAELGRWVDYLARGLVGLVFTLAPEVIVLGTIASAAGDALCFEPLRRRVAGRCWPQLAQGLRIVPSALGSELPFLAGLAVALDDSIP